MHVGLNILINAELFKSIGSFDNNIYKPNPSAEDTFRDYRIIAMSSGRRHI
jgi:hypothetical protein